MLAHIQWRELRYISKPKTAFIFNLTFKVKISFTPCLGSTTVYVTSVFDELEAKNLNTYSKNCGGSLTNQNL
jgi:hypothetical protein